jgi:hypothetical protein
MLKIFSILTLLFIPISSFAANVDVITNPPSGTYHTPIYINLTPTETNAKTFYSFKPDGYPQDAFIYEKPILLKHSSPFIYFSIISTTNESKIKQNNYILEYPATIHFDTKSITGSGKVQVTIINSGVENVDIGFWCIQSLSDIVTIPEHTILHSGEKYGVEINYPGTSSVVLRSPDDDERDILTHKSTEEKTIAASKVKITTKIVPREIISTIANIPENNLPEAKNTPTPESISIIRDTPAIEKTINKTPSINTIPDINQIVKVSTIESGQKNINPLYI